MSSTIPSVPSQAGFVTVNTAEQSSGAPAGQPSNPKMRKRTKTGCLTCRKRRIKCGEERPTCNNCFKSKRTCEGYTQRVIFKPPTMDWPNHPNTSTLPYHTGGLPGRLPEFHCHQIAPPRNQPPPQPQSSSAPFNFGDPSSGPIPFFTDPYVLVGGQAPPAEAAYTQYQSSYAPAASDSIPLFMENSQPGYLPQYQRDSTQSGVAYAIDPSLQYLGNSSQVSPDGGERQPVESSYSEVPRQYRDSFMQPYQEGLPQQLQQHNIPYPGAQMESLKVEDQASQYVQSAPQLHPADANTRPSMPLESQSVTSPEYQGKFYDQTGARLSFDQDMTFSQGQPFAADAPRQHHTPPPEHPFEHRLLTSGFAGDHLSPTQVLDEAAVEMVDDDYWDVQSDDEMENGQDVVVSEQNRQREFGLIMQIHDAALTNVSLRRYDAFLYEGILDEYRPQQTASPLKNPHTARVFAHFVHATGPSLSIYERNPRNTSAIFMSEPVPNSLQSLWTYTLPMMALNNQGLLHAMLALSSLHIAKLQGASITPSLRHYSYSLRRVHRAVGNPKKRHEITTLAASLLLAFYEVMTAEHNKWSTHLAGAKQLIVEIDYKGMTKEMKRRQRQKAAWQAGFESQTVNAYLRQPPSGQSPDGQSMFPDEGLVSTFLGKRLRYDDMGRVIEESDDDQPRTEQPSGAFDQQKFELYQDLYWWYARQDAYQSLVSGNKLLLDYSRWGDCAPRAPMGRTDALYGTHDHLMLLFGRIAQFAAKDRERKVAALKADGGMWKPGPGMPGPLPAGNAGGSASSMPGQASHTAFPPGQERGSQAHAAGGPGRGPPPQMPPFMGMAPSRSPHMPSSYANGSQGRSPRTSEGSPKFPDLGAALSEAMEEWGQIKAALHTFEQNLGADFQPLGKEFHQPLETPFGPALSYRRYDIADIWALLYTAHIIAIRSHPHMPPAAMMAAGVAAQQTRWYAQQVGRIAAGIVPGSGDAPLNPSLGAALIESAIPLFFAGVQYQDERQRRWTVARLEDIDRRTGWHSAGVIALGCQRSWETAASLGRGPPWHRRADPDTARWTAARDVVEDAAGMAHRRGDADMRFVCRNPGVRVHWAMGLLGLDEDLGGHLMMS